MNGHLLIVQNRLCFAKLLIKSNHTSRKANFWEIQILTTVTGILAPMSTVEILEIENTV